MKTILISLLAVCLAANVALAAPYSKKDNAGWTHYYNDKGQQQCISKKDAAGYRHYYCN